MQMQSMTVAALGRVGQLGDFYDVRSDSFVSGMNLFSSLNSDSTTVVDSFHTDSKYVQGDAYDEKCSHLDVSAELKLSVLAGLFQLSGSGKYLNDRKSSSRVSSCTAFYNIKTIVEKVNLFDPSLRSLMCTEAVTAAAGSSGGGATHVVTEVQYGANAMVTFESRMDDTSDTTTVEGMLSAELNKIALSISGKGAVDYRDLELKKFQNLSFKVFGDILSDKDIPQSFEQALVYMKDIPAKVRSANNGRGVPLRYGLFPIAMVRMYLQLEVAQDQLVKSIGETTIQSYVHLFESIAKLKQELHALSEEVQQYEFVIAYEDKSRLTKLTRDLELYEVELKQELKANIIKTRSSAGECALLEDVYSRYTADARCPSSLRSAVYELTLSILDSTSFAKLMMKEGVNFVTARESLDNVILSHLDSDVYVLFTSSKHRKDAGAEWDTNRRLFIALFRNSKKVGANHVFYVKDSSPLGPLDGSGGGRVTKVQIAQYKNGKLVLPDLAATSMINQTPVAKATGLPEPCVAKPNKRVTVELPCPGAFLGSCSNEVVGWQCWKCNRSLEYGFDDACFYCNCGRAKANSFSYKCADLENHGFGFELFDSAVIETLLSNFRPLREINILILGETGVGKSTWINGFVNYLTYPTLKVAAESEDVSLIPSNFMMTDENGKFIKVVSGNKCSNENNDGEGKSATQFPKSYAFPRGDALIRIVDTPGIADTRGIAQDKKNFENIMHHLSHLPEINGIVILLKPQESRTNVLFQFCIKELLTQLHKDAAKNIVFCFTNARSNFYRPGNTKQTLEAVLAQSPSVGLTLNNHTMYCVDNESVRFLAAVQNGVKFSAEETEIYEGSWQKSVTETNRLLEHINGLKAHSTTSTISLNKARNLVLALVEPIGHIAKNIDDNIAVAEQHKEDIRKSMQQKEGHKKNLHIPMIDLQEEEIGYPNTVCAASKCTKLHKLPGSDVSTTEYLQLCHEKCQLTVPTRSYPQPGLQQCWAMQGEGLPCRVCGCRWEMHLHITYKLNPVQKEVINHAVEEMLRATESHVDKVTLVLQQTQKRIDGLNAEREKIAEISSKFAAFLKANAIAPYNDALINYLEHLIDLEERKINNGASRRGLEGLQEMMRTYTAKVKILEDAIKATGTSANVLKPSEIEGQIQILYNLPEQGERLRKLVAIANNAANKNMAFNEQTYVPKQYVNRKQGAAGRSGDNNRAGGPKKTVWYKIKHLDFS